MSKREGDMPQRLPQHCLRGALAVVVLAGGIAACKPARTPVDAAAPLPANGAVAVLPPGAPPPPLQITDPPVEPGSPVAVTRGGPPRPIVYYQQPDRISPPGTPLVLPPPVQRGERQETLVEAVPARITVGRGGADQRRFVAFLNSVGRGRFDALHLEVRGRNRGAVLATIGTARRAGVDPLKIRAVNEPPAGGVEVIVTRYVATAPTCASQAIIGPSVNDNDFEPSLGCSNRKNLATMVNDPADLLANDAVVPADGARAAIGIERYRMPHANGSGRADSYGQGSYDSNTSSGPLGGVTQGAGGPIGR